MRATHATHAARHHRNPKESHYPRQPPLLCCLGMCGTPLTPLVGNHESLSETYTSKFVSALLSEQARQVDMIFYAA